MIPVITILKSNLRFSRSGDKREFQARLRLLSGGGSNRFPAPAMLVHRVIIAEGETMRQSLYGCDLLKTTA
jgi:hypothetical protein